METLTKEFIPSKYQEAIFDFIANGQGHGVVEAVAGSGKTTTLVQGAKYIPTGNVLFLAFNVKIVEALKSKLPAGTDCLTINSVGHRALLNVLGPLKVNSYKYSDLIKESLMHAGAPEKQIFELAKPITQLLSFTQANLKEPTDENFLELIAHYGIELPDEFDDSIWFNMVRDALTTGENLAKTKKEISFDDQIWLTAKWQAKTPQYQFVMVDEAQDLSVAKTVVAMSCCAPGGRMLLVGDSKQALYAFSGADSNSMNNIIASTNATVLPLAICYRCPQAVVRYAQQVVPHIEPHIDAPEGLVRLNATEDEMYAEVKSGDAIICRLTAPLIATCIKLIGMQKPAKVMGRDIGKSLVKIAKDACGKKPFDKFGEYLTEYYLKKAALLMQRQHAESEIQSLEDKVQGVRVCYESMMPTSLYDFQQKIEGLFTDENNNIVLSTIHRIKGLEFPKVFIIRPEVLPMKRKNQRAWEKQGEMNCVYVARTRAQEELVVVRTSKQ